MPMQIISSIVSAKLSPIAAGCTVALASEIAAQRARHAGERIDFHTYFPFRTVAELQRLLRGDGPRDPEDDYGRKDVIVDLLDAQREAPHELWTLLLLVAFEKELVERRRALSAAPDVALDRLVVETFLAAVEDLSRRIESGHLRAYVLMAWGQRLRKAMPGSTLPREAPVSAPPCSGPSAIAGAGEDDDDSTEVA